VGRSLLFKRPEIDDKGMPVVSAMRFKVRIVASLRPRSSLAMLAGARLVGREHRRLALRHYVFRAAHLSKRSSCIARLS
jgi:hypothetical protein